MSTIEVIKRRGRKLVLAYPPLYGLVRYSFGMRAVSLPSAEEARDTLEVASPRPSMVEDTLERYWPAMPEFDVSVIVPCHNVERFVRECIESVLNQATNRSFEVLAIDDGSTDATGVILDDLVSRDGKLRVLHQQNKGLGAARNTGISMAQGATFVFVDSDDVLEPDAIEVLASAYESASCDYVTANFSKMNESGSRTRPPKGVRMHGAPWARMYSREVWRSLWFPEGVWFEDTVQAYCVKPVFREAYLEKSVYRHRAQPNSITMICSHYKKGLDSFWVTEEMLRWCDKLGIPLDLSLFDQTIRQLGPLLYYRMCALSEEERKALFVASCGLLNGRSEWHGLRTSLGGRWRDVEKALRVGDYGLWKLAASSM